jgi:S1-C subfamily serine protease
MKQFFIVLFAGFLCLAPTTNNAQSWYSWGDDDDDKAFLGVQSDQISDVKAEILGFKNPYGSYVTKVLANTAAERAGVQPFDYIYGINEYRADDDMGLTAMIRKFSANDNVTLHLVRKGKRMELPITFGTKASYSSTTSKGAQPFFGINRHSQNNDDKLGVRIYPVANSTAFDLGLRSGDVILSLNDYPMVDWNDISTAIDNMVVGKEIVVEYEREGTTRRASAPIRSYAATKESKKKVERAFLGIYSDGISATKANKMGIDNRYGSYVSSVIGNTAAEAAGIQPMDYIYGIDEYEVNKDRSLTSILRKYYAGEQVTLKLIRQGRQMSVPVTFKSREEAVYRKKTDCEDPFLGIRQNTESPGEKGVRVNIVKSSTAEALGMEDGDVVTSINDYKMYDWTDIGIAIDNMTVGEPILVSWRRNGQAMRGEAPIKSQCDTDKDQSWNFDWLDNMDFDFGWGDDDDEEDQARDTRRMERTRDIGDLKVEMANLSQSEADNMRRNYGIDMPTANDLRISALKLTPNPGAGMFDLEFGLPEEGETTVRIFNNAGRIIYNYELGNYQGDFQDEVDISQNGTGTYYLEIRQNAKTMTQKIILSKV